MKAPMHQYQEFAKNRILEQDATGLFLGLGLGKTRTALEAIDELMHDRFEIRKVLIIAPLRVAQSTWTDEIQKWDNLKHLRASRILGTLAQRIQAIKTDADIYIVNRENVRWLIEQFGSYKDKQNKKGFQVKNWPFDMVVIDEISSFKAADSQRFKFLKKARPFVDKIVGLTGTPQPNGLLDLWAQIYLLDGGERLGQTMTAYKDRFFKPGKQDRSRGIIFEWIPKDGAQEIIFHKLGDLCVSMTAEDWLTMPERIDQETLIELPPEILAGYYSMERDLILELDGQAVIAGNAAALSNKLQQYAQGAVYTDQKPAWIPIHDAKLDALEDLIEGANGQPVLVFYWYKHDLARIMDRFPGARVLKTEDDIHAWNRREIPILLAHPGSAGHGLNLQAGGSAIVWFSLTWSLELYQQANGRLYRQGQASPNVVIFHLVAAGTIDEDILKALTRKASSQAAMLEAVKARVEKYKGGDGGCGKR